LGGAIRVFNSQDFRWVIAGMRSHSRSIRFQRETFRRGLPPASPRLENLLTGVSSAFDRSACGTQAL
jgi:hypothetical protein